MEFENVLTLLLAFTTLCIGIYFGALRAKLMVTKTDNKLHQIIYWFCGIGILIVAIFYIVYFGEFTKPFNWYAQIITFLAVSAAIAVIIFTKKHLTKKSIYSVAELNPIINDFTKMADRSEIMLFGGDLNFFGNTPSDMDSNPQYNFLKSLNFSAVSILCEYPSLPTTQIRYGKLYNELQNLELRFYQPEESDLRVRGRIIKVDGVNKLLMYTKHAPGKYRALETDTANSSGALYHNIWELVWHMAQQPSGEQVNDFKNLYHGR